MFEEKTLDKVTKERQELAKMYEVPTSAIVWIGGCHYIIVKNGKEIWI